MANYCEFRMIVTGEESNIHKFYNIMINNSNRRDTTRLKFPRWIIIGGAKLDNNNNKIQGSFYGDCCWSVATAMRDKNSPEETNLQDLSEQLNLEIEVYSEEPGMDFQEHYYVANGEEIVDDCVDFAIQYFENQQELDEYNTAHNTNYFLNENIREGGFEEEKWVISDWEWF